VTSRARAPAAAALACAVGFALLLAVAYGLPLGGHADAMALDGLIALRGPIATPIATAAAHLADPLPVAGILAGLVALGWLSGRRRQALAAAALVVASTVTAETLKVVLAHPRIQELVSSAHIAAVAFPSGHATAALALALAAVLVVPRGIRAAVAAVAAVYAIAVCTSILILAWHYPSDVFGGMLVASFYFCTAVTVLRVLAAAPSTTAAAKPRSTPLVPLAGMREVLLVAVAVAGVAVVARADDLARFASDHTLATVTALAVAAASSALIAAASLLEP
jgi:membrane-associated phospholipid phosphatase